MRYIIIFILLLFQNALVFSDQPSDKQNTRCIDDNCFVKQHSLLDTLSLFRLAVFKYWGFKIYYSALYFEGTPENSNLIEHKPKLLELYYLYDFTKEDFIKSSREIIGRHGKSALDSVVGCLEKIDQLYVPIKSGDRYSIMHNANGQLSLYHNYKLLGTVCDDKSAQAYFSIWLSNKNSIDSKQQRQLLGDFSETTEFNL